MKNKIVRILISVILTLSILLPIVGTSSINNQISQHNNLTFQNIDETNDSEKYINRQIMDIRTPPSKICVRGWVCGICRRYAQLLAQMGQSPGDAGAA